MLVVKVFISHSSTDKWAARQICKELEQRGIESFLDEKDIETGDSIDDAVDQHLAECDELLMILSPASLSSAWVLIEIGGARALKKRLVPILLHVGVNELPMPISKGLARDINEVETYFDEVVARSEEPRPRREPLDQGLRQTPEVTAARPRTFDLGERVRLPSRVPSSTTTHTGRDIGWNEEMTELLGQTTVVTGVQSEADRVVHVAADDGEWLWIMDWLTPAGEAGEENWD